MKIPLIICKELKIVIPAVAKRKAGIQSIYEILIIWLDAGTSPARRKSGVLISVES